MILTRLRAETKTQHAALERRLPLVDPQMTRESYRELVARFHGYYAPLETGLLAAPWWEEIGLNYHDRRKLPLLKKDLRVLGFSDDGVAGIPRCDDLPLLPDLPHLLGCLYVLEGATLGGQVITRHLQSHLGLTAETGGAFFAGYQAETGPRWQAFCERLGGLAERQGGEDQIIASANRTFATIESWLFPSDRA